MWILRLVPCLIVFSAGFAFLGGAGAVDSSGNVAVGMAGGALVGLFFGLVFGGNLKWRVWDVIFGPEKNNGPDA
jgi:hypothetical protein